MWGEFCNTYAPTGEEHMDLYTLEKLYNKLDNQLEYLKENKSESVQGMELACQTIFGLIMDKRKKDE